ncbi:MAG: hypothetical protein ACHP7K_05410 [Actinomycetales bacterium]|jgi:hypothetical protein
MPWWFWIILWVALLALSLLYVAALGLRLWRQLVAAKRALEGAGGRLAAYRTERAEALRAAAPAAGDGGAERPSPGAAVFASPDQMKDDYTAAKAARQSARRRRRVALRTARGQLRSLRDVDLSNTP